MTLKESFIILRDWSNNHYGLISLVCGIIMTVMAFVQTNRNETRVMIQDHRMGVIEDALRKNEELERERIAYQYDTSKQLREIKGYTQGVQDTKFRELINKLPNEAR